MARRLLVPCLAFTLVLLPRPAEGVIHAGDMAPDFHKTDLTGTPQTLSQYRGKVVVMFLLGYS